MNAAQRYTRTQNQTASAPRLMVMLFEAALKNVRLGAAALERRDKGPAVASLAKASEIVAHLDATLDAARAPEIAENLSRIYKFVIGRLTSAICTLDPRKAREAERALVPVVDGFVKAVAQVGTQP